MSECDCERVCVRSAHVFYAEKPRRRKKNMEK